VIGDLGSAIDPVGGPWPDQLNNPIPIILFKSWAFSISIKGVDIGVVSLSSCDLHEFEIIESKMSEFFAYGVQLNITNPTSCKISRINR
jgi:hypothetical protein